MMSSSQQEVSLIEDKQIENAVIALRAYESKKKREMKKDLLDDRKGTEILLEFSVRKIVPTVNAKIMKVYLPNSVCTSSSDVCLFVGDLDKKDRNQIADTVEYYREQLEKAGIEGITEIIPLLQLKLEYQPYETKRALAARYDMFLADEKILRLLPSYLGKAFYGHKKHPMQVRLTPFPKLKSSMKRAMSSTQCVMSNKGSQNSVMVARLDMTDEEITENVQAALKKICQEVTGGSLNIRSVQLRTKLSPSLPVYVNSQHRCGLTFQESRSAKEKVIPEDISTIDNGKVSVTRDGEVRLHTTDGKIQKILGGAPVKKIQRYRPDRDGKLRGLKGRKGKSLRKSSLRKGKA